MRPVSIIALKVAAAIAATDTGAAVDVSDFTGNVQFVLNSSACGEADNTANVKLQHSDDGAAWTDAGLAFAPVTNAAPSLQTIYASVDTLKKFARVVNTLAGTTPTVSYGVTLVGDRAQG